MNDETIEKLFAELEALIRSQSDGEKRRRMAEELRILREELDRKERNPERIRTSHETLRNLAESLAAGAILDALEELAPLFLSL
jgi:hypothetical protein